MEEKQLSTRYPLEVLETMRTLAEKHERSFNGEVVWALRQYANQQANKKGNRLDMPVSTSAEDQEWISPVISTHSPDYGIELDFLEDVSLVITQHVDDDEERAVRLSKTVIVKLQEFLQLPQVQALLKG